MTAAQPGAPSARRDARPAGHDVPSRFEPSLAAPPRRSRSRRTAQAALAAIGLLSMVAGLAALIDHRVEQIVMRQMRHVLEATLHTASTNLTTTLEAGQRAGVAAATDPDFVAAARACVGRVGECAALEATLQSYVRAGGFARGRFAVRDGSVLSSAPTVEYEPVSLALLEAARALPRGRAVIVSTEPHSDRRVLLVVTPVYERRALGALVLDLPLEPIASVMRATRVALTGETYLFDRKARLLTESRFPEQLAAAGLLARDQSSVAIGLELRDPGVDLTEGKRARRPRAEQPLTRMAASALAGQRGSDVLGYRDYRGVPVIGAWRYLPEHGLGIATELDVTDAYRTLHALQRMFAGVLLVLAAALLLALAFIFVSARLRERTARAELRAERFGQYVLESQLGEGGMGVVYLARHALLRRKAAIKLLRPDRVSPEALARFEREAQITSALTHPNTIEVYDFGRTEGGAFYYVMEYLVGIDLQRLVLRFGPLPQARVLHLLRQMCGSLAEAHAAGIVHRDIKPANLFVCTRGGVADTLKVLDFGIVQVERTEATPTAGTPEYMAPELFESPSAGATARTDLYAVGVLAYFLLTGAHPFAGTTTHELCMAHLTQKPEPIELPESATLDPTLAAAIRSCLAKQESARPVGAASLGALLDRSALARAWTQNDARAWWAEHQDTITDMQAKLASSPRRSLVLPLRTPPI